MARIFELIYAAPLWMCVHSGESCTYLYRMMKLIGWLPPKKGIIRFLYILWTGLTVTVSGVYYPIGLVLTMYMEFTTFSAMEFLNVLQITANSWGATFKICIVIISLTRLNQTRSELSKLDENLEHDCDREIIHKSVAYCNLIFLTYTIVYLGYSVAVLVTGLVNGIPPWMVYNPFMNWRDGRWHYWVHILTEYFTVTVAVIHQLVTDTYTLIFVFMFRAHINVLKNQIRRLRSDPVKDEPQNFDELVRCIKRHQAIINCCDLMRPVISGTIFIQFLIIGFVLGVTLVNVIVFSGFVRGLSSIVYITAVLMQTFPFCYLCDLLVADCEESSNLLAHSQWIDAEPKYKSTLRIFLLKLQQPLQFIAGGIFSITMNSNIKVAKFAFSVMTIVQKMNLGERFK